MSALERQPSMQTRLLLLVLAFATMVWLVAASLTWIGARQEVDELLCQGRSFESACSPAGEPGEHVVERIPEDGERWERLRELMAEHVLPLTLDLLRIW